MLMGNLRGAGSQKKQIVESGDYFLREETTAKTPLRSRAARPSSQKKGGHLLRRRHNLLTRPEDMAISLCQQPLKQLLSALFI